LFLIGVASGEIVAWRFPLPFLGRGALGWEGGPKKEFFRGEKNLFSPLARQQFPPRLFHLQGGFGLARRQASPLIEIFFGPFFFRKTEAVLIVC